MRKGIKYGPLSMEHRKRISESNQGHAVTNETRRKISESKKGIATRPDTLEIRQKISNSMKGRMPKNIIQIKGWNKGQKMVWAMGEKNVNWKGGVTPINEKIRKSVEYKNWRRSVFEKDDFTCQICGQRSGKLQADHIKEFSNYPDLRFEIKNGRTLCKKCHKQTDNYGSKVKKQLIIQQ